MDVEPGFFFVDTLNYPLNLQSSCLLFVPPSHWWIWCHWNDHSLLISGLYELMSMLEISILYMFSPGSGMDPFLICTPFHKFCMFPGWDVPLRPLRWRHNGGDGVSNHQPHDCLLNRLFRRRSKKTSKIRVTGLCAGNSPGTGEFPAQVASNGESVSIRWRHHALTSACYSSMNCLSAVSLYYVLNKIRTSFLFHMHWHPSRPMHFLKNFPSNLSPHIFSIVYNNMDSLGQATPRGMTPRTLLM